jgi:hypothetical protein
MEYQMASLCSWFEHKSSIGFEHTIISSKHICAPKREWEKYIYSQTYRMDWLGEWFNIQPFPQRKFASAHVIWTKGQWTQDIIHTHPHLVVKASQHTPPTWPLQMFSTPNIECWLFPNSKDRWSCREISTTTIKGNTTNDCSHNLLRVAHKVTDHHLHHERQWQAAMTTVNMENWIIKKQETT